MAVKRGKHVVDINPSGTSQNCSECNARVPKTLAVRVHNCKHCGTVLDRDYNPHSAGLPCRMWILPRHTNR